MLRRALLALAPPLFFGSAAAAGQPVALDFAQNASGRRFDGIGGLSGGGATSTFLLAYKEPQRSQILDWMFKPGFGASLNILKVEVGSDDQTTDGCEGCHMRSADEVDCHRGYEWGLMKEAAKRNPSIILYGLPWAWAGWLGFGTNSPYANVTATADYTAKWIECGRDAHGLNISVIGLWNEEPGPVPYILALRKRLDEGGLSHVRIIAPDGGGDGMDSIAREMAGNASVKAAVGALGSHYPGSKGTTPLVRGAGVPAWSAEDYSTYSDATGAGCWGRLLVQNMGWDLSATISWYLIGSFARGMDYDSDGILRAEWPNSGHFELTPMLWTTMHWTRFVQPGWRALPCTDASVPTGRCALAGGGNYAAMASPDSGDIAIIVHAFRHNTSKCIRCDPPDWTVADKQAVSFALGGLSPKAVHVWRSCSGWEYPSATDGWFEQQPDASVGAGGALDVEIEADCMYTFTTVGGVTKPPVPATTPHSAAFPLPYEEDFDGMLVGAEAPYFGDQMGKFETVAAGGGRGGNVSRQQLPLGTWPICNRGHSQPLSIIGDFFFADVEVSADIFIETAGVGAGLALRVRNACFFRGVTPGVYLFVGDATPAIPQTRNPDDPNCGFQGGIPSLPNIPLNASEWKICSNSYCDGTPIASGKLPAAWGVGEWHRLSLTTVGDEATAAMDGTEFFRGPMTVPHAALPAGARATQDGTAELSMSVPSCAANMTVLPHGEILAGDDYRQTQLQSDPSDVKHCVEACCADNRCSSWAVATSAGPTSPTCRHNSVCCFLKDGVPKPQKRSGELAAGFKPGHHGGGPAPAPSGPPHPQLPFGGVVPVSGWAALVTTLGGVQYDNFKIDGKAPGGGAVAACGSGMPAAGDEVVSTPCDAPNARAAWEKLPSGQLRLRSTKLCLGSSGGAAVLASCGSDEAEAAALLTHDRATGRIISASAATCLDVTSFPGAGGKQWPQAVTNASCVPIPDEKQQYQFHPATGALRPKASTCIAGFASTVNQYRDCCLAVC